ncbi:ubiquitin-like domain-containing protein CIP73 [Diospyros lotus]|uniref:ubiquitin-like domain-containing protein CIP73 n=1 Tax=Diospyros lotus TaxID=55363 RepID=UPI00224E2057|nr:ubiquitin-like domain-containing protein CIP73 [Diospyros lotus]
MGSSGGDEGRISGSDMAKCSEATVEIKIKTLDSHTYTLRVDKCVSVSALKEQIATLTGMLSEQQTLICRGRVLKDDQLLSAYYVEDGHTLHLVARQPVLPSSGSSPDCPASSLRQQGNNAGARVVIGAFNLSEQGGRIPSGLSRFISAILDFNGITNIGSGNEGADAIRDASAESFSRIHAGSLRNSGRQGNSTRRGQSIPSSNVSPSLTSVPSEPLQLPVIPDSLSTLSQYLTRIRREFRANVGGENGNSQAAGTQGNDGQESAAAGQAGLPTPSFLADVVLSTRQILTEQAADCLSELSRQLENQANVIDPLARTNIQSNAIRSGILLQNLGALLLELGRTTMTLRMGQSPADTIVNAGPPVFVSMSGPNPIMVQPLPYQLETNFGAIPIGTVQHGFGLSRGSLGSGFLPRNVDISVHSGPLMRPPSANQREPSGGQQSPVRSSQLTSGSRNSSHQATPGASGSPSLTREYEVRALPIGTVVTAIPASLRQPPADLPRGSMGLVYPVLARSQGAASGNLNNGRDPHTSDGPRAGGLELGQQPTAGLRQNVGADVRDGSGQVTPATSEASPRVSDQGLFFSNLLREIIPAISEIASGGSASTSSDGEVETEDIATQAEENADGEASARQRRDPQCPSSSKRQRRE